MKTNDRPITKRAIALAAALVLLTGCAPSAADRTQAPTGPAVTIDDAWVKSAPEGMTAGFGILSNATDDDVTIVAAESDAAERVELHETVADTSTGGTTMREVEGGFVIPARGTLELAPGGDHLMLMGLTAPVEAGQDVTFTLRFSDDSTMSFTSTAKDFAGAQEHYSSDHDEHTGDSHESEHKSDQSH